jgi:hypothetical protein
MKETTRNWLVVTGIAVLLIFGFAWNVYKAKHQEGADGHFSTDESSAAQAAVSNIRTACQASDGTIPKDLIVSQEAREDNVFALRTANGATEQYGTKDAHAILKNLSFSAFLLEHRRREQKSLSEQDSKLYTCLKGVWAELQAPMNKVAPEEASNAEREHHVHAFEEEEKEGEKEAPSAEPAHDVPPPAVHPVP